MKYRIKDFPEIKNLVDSMSVDELLRAVICPNVRAGIVPPKNTSAVFVHPSTTENARKISGYINSGRENRALVVADMEYGAGTAIIGAIDFSSMRAIAETGNIENAYKMGVAAAKEALISGYHWTFGPCVDILANRYSPIVSMRTAGEDADTVIKFGGAYMEGLQNTGLIATLKHFPGDGYSHDDQHVTVTENPLSKKDWDKSYGKIYSSLIKRGAMAIMPGHISLPSYDEKDKNGLFPPATTSKKLLTDLLKKKLGFEGIIVSDATEMGGFCGYMNFYHACAAFLEAGGDCLLFVHETEEFMNSMKKCIDEGRLSIDVLKNRAYRMICFGREYFEKHPEGERIEFDKEEAELFSKRMSEESIKIIRDRQKILPYKIKSNSRIAHVVLYNSWCESLSLADELTNELRKLSQNVDELRDPGPEALERIAKSGDYEIIICSVFETVSWAINTSRLSGPVCRNMMRGWMRYDTPTIFISSQGVAFEDTFKPLADTVINTYGSTKYTAKAIVERFFK